MTSAIKRVIVTGGAGFIGSAVARNFVNELGYEVFVIDKLTYAGSLDSVRSIRDNPRFHFHHVDICDEAAVNDVFRLAQPDGVLHLAAESHVDRSITHARAFVDTNVAGTFTLLDAFRGHISRNPGAAGTARFLHVSTDEVFGALGADGLFTEASPYDPSSPYAATKAAADHLARAWHRTYGLPIVISNCSNNFGPYHFPEKLIPLTILSALEGRPIPVYGTGANVRDWLYVDDHVRALARILWSGIPGESYNIGGGNERRNIDVVRKICELMDRMHPVGAPHDRLIRFVEDRPGHDYRYAIDSRKLQGALGWTPAETFETGLEKTVAWYLANQDWWEPIRADTYRGERLGL